MRARIALAVIALGLSVIAGVTTPRTASADIGPCNGCTGANIVNVVNG